MRTPVSPSHHTAIETKFLGPTDYRGSRIVVRVMDPVDKKQRMIVNYDHALDARANHDAAAVALVNSLKSHERIPEATRLVSGGTDRGWVYLMVTE